MSPIPFSVPHPLNNLTSINRTHSTIYVLSLSTRTHTAERDIETVGKFHKNHRINTLSLCALLRVYPSAHQNKVWGWVAETDPRVYCAHPLAQATKPRGGARRIPVFTVLIPRLIRTKSRGTETDPRIYRARRTACLLAD